MNKTVKLTHYTTKKDVIVISNNENRYPVSAIIVGDLVLEGKNYPGVNWIVLETVPNPIPVLESQSEILKALGLSTQEQ